MIKKSLAIYCLIVTAILVGGAFAQENADATRFVWTDSLIAARGTFAAAPPYKIAKPEKIDGKSYWLGGVFVIPGTNPQVLSKNGFKDVELKHSSVMHDYYEARWPVEMELNNLPLQIRQVRYVRERRNWYRPKWHQECPPGDSVLTKRSYYNAQIETIPGLPNEFFSSYGIRRFLEPDTSTDSRKEYVCDWPTNPKGELTPPEIYSIRARPNKIILKHQSYRKRDDGRLWFSGYSEIDSASDSLLLVTLGVNPLLTFYGPSTNHWYSQIVWPVELVVDSLPPGIKYIIESGEIDHPD